MRRQKRVLLKTIATLALAASTALFAQGPRGRGDGTFDPLGRLKRALSEAGAPALTSSQEDRIKTLIENFRGSRSRPEPSAAMEAARTAFNEAILNGNFGGASAQASILASEMSANASTRLKEEAQFGIDVIKELRTNGDTVGALQKSLGTNGVVRLVQSLGGSPGGPGRPGGPMGPRPARPE